MNQITTTLETARVGSGTKIHRFTSDDYGTYTPCGIGNNRGNGVTGRNTVIAAGTDVPESAVCTKCFPNGMPQAGPAHYDSLADVPRDEDGPFTFNL